MPKCLYFLLCRFNPRLGQDAPLTGIEHQQSVVVYDEGRARGYLTKRVDTMLTLHTGNGVHPGIQPRAVQFLLKQNALQL